MITYHEYWQQVDQIAQMLADPDALAEEYGEDADPSEVLWEITDGHEFVIYYNKAAAVMQHSDNQDAYWEEMGETPAADSWWSLLPPLAMMAMQADIQDRMQRVGSTPNPFGQALVRGGRKAGELASRGYQALGRGAQAASSYAGQAFEDACHEAGFRPNPHPNGKWGRQTLKDGTTVYEMGGAGAYVVIVPYKPRKSLIASSAAAFYEYKEGRKVPKGTKWLAVDGGVSAHRTLKAAKKAGGAVAANTSLAGERSSFGSLWSQVRQNPWPNVPEGALATSYSPPPGPFGRQNAPMGYLSSSLDPPLSPQGREAYSSGMLQGQRVMRSYPPMPRGRYNGDDEGY